jgi:predicted SprT family Zn-dependent metalloprotease
VERDAAAALAMEHMARWGLDGWTFRFDGALRRFGACDHRGRTITLSRHLVALNGPDAVRDTVLHEIAHALVDPRHGHDAVWRAKAAEIGADPRGTYGAEVAQPRPRWIGTCPGCGQQVGRVRRPGAARSCSACGGGRWDRRFVLRWEPSAG